MLRVDSPDRDFMRHPFFLVLALVGALFCAWSCGGGDTPDDAEPDASIDTEDTIASLPGDTAPDLIPDLPEDTAPEVEDIEEVETVDAVDEPDEPDSDDQDVEAGDADVDAEVDAEPECVVDRDCDDDNVCTADRCIDEACTYRPRDTDFDGSPDSACGGNDCEDDNPDVSAGSTRPCTSECDLDGIERCVDGEWQDCTAPTECTCRSGDIRHEPCGRCGTAGRVCLPGSEWGPISECLGFGACEPGNVEIEPCDELICGLTAIAGFRYSTCSDECRWETGACESPPDCCPRTTSRERCDDCTSRNRTCDATGQWGESGECTPDECCLDETDERPCNSCGVQRRACTDEGRWSTWGVCLEPACCDGEEETTACGFCGEQERICEGGRWTNVGECAEPLCCEGDIEILECGICGEERRECIDVSWTTGDCVEPECCPDDTEERDCNDCGRQSRACVARTWADWGDCAGARPCRVPDECTEDGFCECVGSPDECRLPSE